MTTIEDVTSTAGPRWRARRRLRGGLVTIGTVAALLAAMGLTLLGLGAADNAVANFDACPGCGAPRAASWPGSTAITARVDTRMEVPGGRRHQMQVDPDRPAADPAGPQHRPGQLAGPGDVADHRDHADRAGAGVSVALHDGAAFVVDAVQGIVRQLDPRALTPVGEPVRYPPGITGGTFDGEGKLWVGVPSEGTVSAVTAADLPATPGEARRRRAQPEAGRDVRRGGAGARVGGVHAGRGRGGAGPHVGVAGDGHRRGDATGRPDHGRAGQPADAHQRAAGAGHRAG